MRHPPEHLTSREFEDSTLSYYQLFAEVSGTEHPTIVHEAQAVFSDITALPPDPFEAGKILRRALFSKGFRYDDSVFCLQDVLSSKKANCLGLSLLIGAELKRRGIEPLYALIMHPLDAIDGQEKRLFKELMDNEYFSYDKPILTTEQAELPQYRFVPLEHPALVLGGNYLETTSLDAAEEAQEWSPKAEVMQPVNFTEVASNVYIDCAKNITCNTLADVEEQKQLVLKALDMWPKNREAWSLLFFIARTLGDQVLQAKAREKYMEDKGTDSRFYNTCYDMTGDTKFLDLALEQFPCFIYPFMQKGVILQKDVREARFNLAVASALAANSSVVKLKDFYQMYSVQVERLFGKPELQSLLKKLSRKRREKI